MLSTPSLLVVAAAGSVAAGGAAVALAHDPAAPPVVTLKATSKKVAVKGAGALKAGPIQFSLSTPSHRTLSIVQLKPGKTAADLKTAINASSRGLEPVFKVASLRGGGGSTGRKAYTFTVDLGPATYEVVDDTQKPRIEGEFTVAAGPNGASLPASEATVTMDDFKIAASGALPTSGIVKVVNKGSSPHFIAFARLKRASDATKVKALLKKGGKGEAKAQKLLDPRTETELVSLISPKTTDVIRVTGLKPGSWMMACFYGDKRSHGKEHTMLGMETVVKVK